MPNKNNQPARPAPLSCSGSPDPNAHQWNDAYPIEVCGICGADRDILENNWCKKIGAPHVLRGCRCIICGEEVHDWAFDLVDSFCPGEPAKIHTVCRRCGYKNPDYETKKAFWSKEEPPHIPDPEPGVWPSPGAIIPACTSPSGEHDWEEIESYQKIGQTYERQINWDPEEVTETWQITHSRCRVCGAKKTNRAFTGVLR